MFCCVLLWMVQRSFWSHTQSDLSDYPTNITHAIQNNFTGTRWEYHSAPTGARNSSLGHPNMAEASLGKNFPKVIPSLLHVFNGWYLQSLVIWCVSLSRLQKFWGKRRHLARRYMIFHRGIPESQLVDARNSNAWINRDARNSGKMPESE